MDAAKSKNSNPVSVASSSVHQHCFFTGVSDLEMLEVLACREGLALASDLLVQKARVASDCLNAVSLQEDGMVRMTYHSRNQGDNDKLPEERFRPRAERSQRENTQAGKECHLRLDRSPYVAL